MTDEKEERKLSCSDCGKMFNENEMKRTYPLECPNCGAYGPFYYVFPLPDDLLEGAAKDYSISFSVTLTADSDLCDDKEVDRVA